jgi:LDH2 family malate/lactate/ureidoglycolate dehydrogenase
MVIALKIDLFLPADAFKAEMDAYVRSVRQLEAFTPGESSYLPGGVEAERERAFAAGGIPVGTDHRQRLESVATEFGLTVPWD